MYSRTRKSTISFMNASTLFKFHVHESFNFNLKHCHTKTVCQTQPKKSLMGIPWTSSGIFFCSFAEQNLSCTLYWAVEVCPKRRKYVPSSIATRRGVLLALKTIGNERYDDWKPVRRAFKNVLKYQASEIPGRYHKGMLRIVLISYIFKL